MRTIVSSFLIASVALVALGCGGEDGNQGILRAGFWLGDRIDFKLCGDEARDVRIKGVACSGTEVDPSGGGELPCYRQFVEELPAPLSIDGDRELRFEGELFVLTGRFTGPDTFVGEYKFVDESCCAVIGDLAADFKSPGAVCTDTGEDTVEPDAGDEDTATPDTVEEDVNGEEVAAQIDEKQQLALGLVNDARQRIGMHVLTTDERIEDAAMDHAAFVVKYYDQYEASGLSVHDENPTWDGYTGTSFGDRLEYHDYPFSGGWEIMAFYGEPLKAIGAWLDTLYHRIPIVHPNAHQLGYGFARGDTLRVDVMDFTNTYQGASEDPSLYPGRDAVDVPIEWAGNESPQPKLPIGAEYPSGPVITICVPFLSPAKEWDTFLIKDASGAEVPSHWLNPHNDELLVTTHALLPLDPLEPASVYEVTFTGTRSGQPVTITWTFTTED